MYRAMYRSLFCPLPLQRESKLFILSSKTVLNSQLGWTCKFRCGLTRVRKSSHTAPNKRRRQQISWKVWSEIRPEQESNPRIPITCRVLYHYINDIMAGMDPVCTVFTVQQPNVTWFGYWPMFWTETEYPDLSFGVLLVLQSKKTQYNVGEAHFKYQTKNVTLNLLEMCHVLTLLLETWKSLKIGRVFGF